MSLFPFPRLFPTCFGPSWAHHQGYYKLFYATIWFMQCFIDHLCASVRWRTQTINKALHEPNGSTKKSLKYPWWWAQEGPKHIGKRQEKGNKDIVQKSHLLVILVVCCQVQVYATGWSLVQRSPTQTSTMRGPMPSRAVVPRNKICCSYRILIWI